MKTITHLLARKFSALAALATTAIYFSTAPAQAANYAGNGNTGFGGTIGNGILSLTDNGTNISGTLTIGGGMNDVLVLYVDTGAAGGFTSTTNFNDQNDGLRKAISGINGSSRSLLTFTNGFTPKFAVALGPNSSSFGGIWQLVAGGNNSLSYLTSANLNPVGTATGPFTFSIPATSIGLTNNQAASIRIFGTYISQTSYRSTEAICGNIYGPFGQGNNPFSQTAFATYNFATPPPPTYAVTFSVDMAAQVQLGNFIPGTDAVFCGGSFQTNPFAFSDFPLVQVGSSTIYTNTYLVGDPTNTVETYKFQYTSNSVAFYDGDPNRSFTLKSGGQILPLVYFDNVPASPPATQNSITFLIDMGPQIYLGHFDPGAGDLVKVYGSFESPKWSGNFPPIGNLTNNPTLSGNASNIYSGTFVDGNYPGTVHQYKYVIAPFAGGTTYESGSDRTLVTPTNAVTNAVAYFNGVSTYAAIPITFSVDMTVPLLTHQLDLGRGDTVGCAGTFQTNSFGVGVNGFTLDPSMDNPNIYTGTYVDRNAPGAGEQYKFVINTNGGDTAYEQPISTGGGNRQFLLGSVAATNPLVAWSDYSTNDITLVDTTVTFTVNMTNAFDLFGFPFDPDNDLVMVDGNYLNPQWAVLSHANDFFINSSYPNNVLTRSGTSLLYTGTFVVPAGNSLQVDYKYGIYHDTANLNTNVDNEASFGLNHSRYIRSVGSTYNFPTDIFGQQRTDLAGATEPEFGQLGIGALSSGQFPINWLGRRGVHLQSNTNLAGGLWQDVNGTDGYSSTNWTQTVTPRYFRLIKP